MTALQYCAAKALLFGPLLLDKLCQLTPLYADMKLLVSAELNTLNDKKKKTSKISQLIARSIYIVNILY